ncbi:uncharacterized protein LOC124175290 isoform X1 [Neodiprion fabricii]|uniref:uncharacterized protein LOC124175290 isoform X1 n=1 Tax=Neodiprion fabricii TaxID=2872261 RepID=UPI001ED8F150|nr:uncharacterized protein LOC124175290 isoform X1 [Neodiprion fabricii]
MGLVSSTFASLAIQLAWNCQRLLDPQYRCVELKRATESPSPDNQKLGHTVDHESQRPTTVVDKRSPVTHLNQRTRVINRQRYRKRPASFDTAMIANRCDNPSAVRVTCVVTSTPSLKRNPQPQFWDVTSSSGCSSDSGSYLDSDSDVEDRLSGSFAVKKHEETEDEKTFSMSAEEEAALRMTVGRGHFSRSKKDRFLNHLRLEKRLNGLSDNFCGANHRGRGGITGRRYSGDLYRVLY